jgi:hypothetical protein
VEVAGTELVVTGFGVATGAGMAGAGGSVFGAVVLVLEPKSGGGGFVDTTIGAGAGVSDAAITGCGGGVVVAAVAAEFVAATVESLFSVAGGVASACAAAGSSGVAADESPRCHFKPAQAPTATRKAPATPIPSFVSRVMGDPSSVEPLAYASGSE